MGPKNTRLARKRPSSPVPDTDATASPLEIHTRGKCMRLPEPPSCPRGPGVVPDNDRTDEEVRARPSADGQKETSARHSGWENFQDDESRIDWYVKVAVDKLKGVLRRANEDKLSRADLWELLTFGQHMYAGMKQQYGIDLNTALVERTVKNAAKGLTPLGQRDESPWDTPAPRRCRECSRVIVEDLEPLSPRHPWKHPPMTDAEIDELNRSVKALGADTCRVVMHPFGNK